MDRSATSNALRLCGLAALALAWASCVERVDLVNAPCPCLADNVCCETLGMCLEPGQTCPAQYPSSTGRACQRDDDCPANEACQAWSIGSTVESLAGLRQCRVRCLSNRCPQDETCRLIPSDGQPLRQPKLASLCVAKSPGAGCQGWTCDQCSAEHMGRTFCQGNDMYGCLLTAHPLCGLACRQERLQECERCYELGGDAVCEPVHTSLIPPSVCDLMSCASCVPGSMRCKENTVVSCSLATYGDSECQEICQQVPIAACAGSCVEQPDGTATCAP